VTGFSAKRRGLAGYLERIGEIDRAACRRRAGEKYSVERMVSDYEVLYRKIAAR
jgi:hypothetical protein